jgi:hypothetical protein
MKSSCYFVSNHSGTSELKILLGWLLQLTLIRNSQLSWTSQSQSQSHIATDGQSVSKSWCRAPSGATPFDCLKRILSSSYIAAERTWIYGKHISRGHNPASLLARRSDLQKIRHLVSIHCCVMSPRTQKTHLPLLLLVGPCLWGCCLATRW